MQIGAFFFTIAPSFLRNIMKTTTFKFAVAAAAVFAAFGATAADYPEKGKTITIVVPFTAGGPTDRVARDLAEALRKPLNGATIVIDNTAGAGSSIGMAKVARANPDGYTLLLNHIGMATVPGLYRKLPFNVEKDSSTWASSTMCR